MEEEQHRQKLKSACKHIKGKHKLCKRGEECVISHRTNLCKTGTYIVDRCGNRGKGGDQIVSLKRNKKNRCNEKNDIANDKGINASYDLVVNRL